LNGEVDHLSVQPIISAIARIISAAENFPEQSAAALDNRSPHGKNLYGTGTWHHRHGRRRKVESLVDELVRRFLLQFPDKTIGNCIGRSVQTKNRWGTYWVIASA
jgi:methylmalonyl-CoA mutase